MPTIISSLPKTNGSLRKNKAFLAVVVILSLATLTFTVFPSVTEFRKAQHQSSSPIMQRTKASYLQLRRETAIPLPLNGTHSYSPKGLIAKRLKYPRVIGWYNIKQKTVQLPPLETIQLTERYIESVLNELYTNIINTTYQDYTDTCIPMASWQTQAYPTCNKVHEIDLLQGMVNDEDFESSYYQYSVVKRNTSPNVRLIGMGGSRLVFVTKRHTLQYDESGGPELFAMKMLRMDRSFQPSMYENHRVDAISSEQLTSARDVMDIYGFCGMSALNELSSGYDMHHLLKSIDAWEPFEILEMILQASSSMANVHSIDYISGTNATLVHNDITQNNYAVSMNSTLKLNDFNRAVPLRWNKTSDEGCGYLLRRLGGSGGLSVNSPPESTLRTVTLSEKTDIYGLGTLIFHFLTRRPIFDHELHYEEKLRYSKISMEDKILQLLNDPKPPRLPKSVRNSTDPVILGLTSVMRQALQHNATDRPTARDMVRQLEGLYTSVEQREEVLRTLHHKIPKVLLHRYPRGSRSSKRDTEEDAEDSSLNVSDDEVLALSSIEWELHAAKDHIENLEKLLYERQKRLRIKSEKV